MLTHHSGCCYGKNEMDTSLYRSTEIDHKISHHMVKVVCGSAIASVP